MIEFLLGLSGATQLWPTDEEVRSAVRTTPFYAALTRRRLRMLLDAVEASMHDSKVGPYTDRDLLTIEHVLPQGWEDNWPLPAGVEPLEARIERDAAKHRLGNLALVTSPLNSALSNAPWVADDGPSKREALERFNQYQVNKGVLAQNAWGEAEIRARSEALADAILEIWPKPTKGE